jgi:general secretion pathway protein L
VEAGLVRRLALLTLAILLATVAIQVTSIFRYTFAADALEMEADRVSASAAPRGGTLSGRLASLRGGGVGYGAIASATFAAVRDTPNVELTSLAFDQAGTLRVTAQADSPATLAALQQRIRASGFEVDAGTPRSAGGRPAADLIVRPQ